MRPRVRRDTATHPCVSRLGIRKTGQNDNIVQRSGFWMLRRIGSRCRLVSARTDRPDLILEHTVVSSCLNRPIVGLTPPKLPASAAISGIIAHLLSCKCSFIIKHFFLKVKQLSTNYCKFFRHFFRLFCTFSTITPCTQQDYSS